MATERVSHLASRRASLGWLALVAMLSLPAVWQLVTTPFFASDDGLFHLYRVAALDEALRQGVLYPRLFPSFAFGYGQAVLSYYGPLTYYVAEWMHLLGASVPDALKWTFALGYALSGCAAFVLARQFASPLPALVGGVAYVYFPYHLAETYQRGALAEHWAYVFLPLVLWGAAPFQISNFRFQIDKTRTLVFVFSLAALIVTHSLTALIFFPFVILYVIITRWKLRVGSWELGVSPLASLALAAFYWLPAAAQSRWVGLSATADSDGYRQHLAPLLSFVQPSLVFQYAPQQIVAADHPLGLPTFALLLAALALALRAWTRRDPLVRAMAFFVLMAFAALYMATDLSLPVWTALHNLLAYLQYPWRFLTLAALGFALSVALLVEMITRATSPLHPFTRLLSLALFALLIVTSTAALPLRSIPTPASDAQAMWQNDVKEKQIGATWTAEYVPWWVRADRTAIPNPARAPAADVSRSAVALSLADAGYAPTPVAATFALRLYRLFAPLPQNGVCEPLTLRFHQFYLPQWRVTLGGKLLSTYPSTDLGLLTVDVPCLTPGQDILELNFASTTIEQVAWLISLGALALVAWRWRGRCLLGAAALLLLIALPLLAVRLQSAPAVQFVSDTQLENVADLVAVRFDRATYRAGDSLHVTLTWLARRETNENLKVFVHLTDASGARVIAQSDGDPVGGFTPTSQWRAGEIVEDTRVLQIPLDAPTGRLRLFAGLYRYPSLKRLVTRAESNFGLGWPNDRIPIGEIELVAR